MISTHRELTGCPEHMLVKKFLTRTFCRAFFSGNYASYSVKYFSICSDQPLVFDFDKWLSLGGQIVHQSDHCKSQSNLNWIAVSQMSLYEKTAPAIDLMMQELVFLKQGVLVLQKSKSLIL